MNIPTSLGNPWTESVDSGRLLDALSGLGEAARELQSVERSAQELLEDARRVLLAVQIVAHSAYGRGWGA